MAFFVEWLRFWMHGSEFGGVMEKGLRMWVKAVLIIAGLMLLCFLVGRREPKMDAEKEARIRQYEEDETVEKIETVLLAYGEMFLKEEEDAQILTTSGIYTYETEEVKEALYRQVTAYVRGDTLLEVVTKEDQSETLLSNLWVSEVENDRILCFLSGDRFYLPVQVEKENREQVADIVLFDGGIKECRFKTEKISGKLLGVSADKIRLSEKELELTENVKVYRLYGDFKEMTLQDLKIGYENVDYVLEKGKVCACLITSEENMETIRVLIQSGNYGGNYHDAVTVTADCDYTLQYGDETEQHKKGEEIRLTGDSEYYQKEDRVCLTMAVNSGRVTLTSIERSRERTDYRGALEIIKTEDGLAVINELLLEEYLYGVVPSEMPANYPEESLKVQAVCARTYAYGNMQKAGLPELGAHVDDSTAFQVYGNIEERAETTAAVKATKGQILTYEEMPINAYYYSTSCGFGTDLRAWNGSDAETEPYLQAKAIKPEPEIEIEIETETEAELTSAEAVRSMQEEEDFAAFIQKDQPDFPESEEAWFRWRYEVEKVDVEEMERRLLERYLAQPGFVLTKKGDDYISQQPKKIGTLKGLQVVRRNTGGNVAELLIEGEKGTYLVQTEYNIRYLLNNGTYPVIRMDGTESVSTVLLPSSFFVLEARMDDDTVTGYALTGGGYGHGIGMSQNGAKNMALQGMTAKEILLFFYEGSEMETIY